MIIIITSYYKLIILKEKKRFITRLDFIIRYERLLVSN